jgi:hypothetical protein
LGSRNGFGDRNGRRLPAFHASLQTLFTPGFGLESTQ